MPSKLANQKRAHNEEKEATFANRFLNFSWENLNFAYLFHVCLQTAIAAGLIRPV